MHLSLALALLPLSAHAVNIIIGNDDGWAEKNIRVFYEALTKANHSAMISAPAENKSGRGPLDYDPHDLTIPCEYDSCPKGSPAVGHNASEPRWNWVNGPPKTAMRYGINDIAPKIFNATPALAVTGVNVGSNLDIAGFISGTMHAAAYAAHDAGIPAVAFSGASGERTAFDDQTPGYSTLYADLATKLVNRLIEGGPPYLPEDTFLNVNFPKISDKCAGVDDYKFVLSRMWKATWLFSDGDANTCNSEDKRLPTERKVTDKGCFVSVSAVEAGNIRDATATVQREVIAKLGDLLTCLPRK
ncbi:survival protein sure-like phosphatase/nucleotidase [Aspergillus avenaceus]|uniref:Survival protein sure-like phosphatase/nucleotidase n=1 Tax=Aspergillus avenaceus TaxID=36643 RepID=A0A5N6U7R5_ASPAV|nr:survival protein sure-like phosphatase/nucleotidase [Aspergillus avenaceus]